MRVGDIFAGIGGFSLGFEQAEYEIVWQIEIDRFARRVLARHWPAVARPRDVRTCVESRPAAVDVICGGDPCPCRSRARGAWPSREPDLSGWFLALVGRCRPRWVVRENVPAPDVEDFAAGLEALGYGVTVVELNARDFTPQVRVRQFVIGCPPGYAPAMEEALSHSQDGAMDADAQDPAQEGTYCLTAHPRRLAEDTVVLEGSRLRSLSPEEREALQGFPGGWTAGLSFTRRCLLLGRAVCVPVAHWIAERIKEVEGQ